MPRLFSGSDDPYTFTCEPLENAAQVERVVWRRFSSPEDVTMFLEGRDNFTDCIIRANMSDGIFSLNGTKDQELTINGSEPENVVFYYVPSFQMMGSERVTAETLIFSKFSSIVSVCVC